MSSWRGWASIFGGVLINLACGTIYSFGNMTPYTVSYVRKHGRESDLTYQTVIVCTSVLFAANGIGITVGTLMERKHGGRKTILCGCLVGWFGMASSFLSINVSFYFFLFTYGCLFGLSSGWAYVPTVISGFKWFPGRRGLVSGFLLSFFGMGAFVFDFIQTLFINPHNLVPNDVEIVGERKEIYYTQDSVLNRTPGVFLLQAGLSVIVQVIGLMLQYDPTDYHQDTEMQTLLDNEEKMSSANGEEPNDFIRAETSPDMEMKSVVTEGQDHCPTNAPPSTPDGSISGRGGRNGTPTNQHHQGVVTGEGGETKMSHDASISGRGGHNGTPTNQHHQSVVIGEGRECSRDPLSSGLSLSVSEVIRRPYIWRFLAMNAACIFTGVAFLGSYKAYGIDFIKDDIFLAGTGSIAAICNFLGHLATGLSIDHISIKVTTLLISGMMSSLVLLVSATSLGGKFPFLAVVCGVFFTLGGAFATQPVISIRAYGEEHFAGNFILVTLLGSCAPNILATLLTFVQKFLSWTTMYIFFGLVPGLAMFPGMFMNLKNQRGQDL